jgi:hypothetical protein
MLMAMSDAVGEGIPALSVRMMERQICLEQSLITTGAGLF